MFLLTFTIVCGNIIMNKYVRTATFVVCTERKGFLMKIGFVSLGCPKNQLDVEVMLHEVVSAGYEITPDETEAEIIIINTCGFIESAKQEAIDEILNIAELKEGKLKKLIVTGCLAQRYGADILENFPDEVDAVVGVFCFDKICDIVCETLKGAKKVYLEKNDKENFNNLPRIQTTPFYYAYLKIAEGCNNRCAYCAIPKIRGGYVSREMNSLVKEAETLASNGVTELIVVAQDTTRYGIDLYGENMLIPLLEKLSEIDGIKWIRLHYLYPEMIDEKLLYYIRDNKKIVNYFDIPIQHINDRILKLMNRRSDRAQIEALMKNIRRILPDAAIRTTVITGFPSETDEEFEELYEFIKEIEFDRLGSFAFSKEEGTAAYSLKPQIPKKTKEQRNNRIMKLQSEIMEKNNQLQIGKTYEVLVEGFHNEYGVYFGRTYKDSVDIDGMVMFESESPIEFGDYVTVEITGADGYDLTGKIK